MANLIILRKGKETKNLNEQEIHPEANVETMIFENKSILPEIALLKRQLSSYTREERIDVVGIDNENNIVVIEIKDETVNETVIPQVMRYAMWLETHPDAVKSVWLEQRALHEDFDFDWSRLSGIKILIVGPSFKSTVPRMANRIGYPVELVEFKKFSDGENDYIFLNRVETDDPGFAKPVDTTREYNLAYYKKNMNPQSAEEFWNLCNRIEKYVQDKGWNLSRSNTGYYVSFKSGFPIVFGVTFVGSKSFCLFFKVSEKVAKSIEIKGYSLHKYEPRWRQALFKVESGGVDLTLFDSLFSESYRTIVGE